MNCSKFKEKYKIEEINGIKYYKNTGEPTGKYRPQAKFLFELKGPENVPDSMKGFGAIVDLISDFNDNIYVLDGEHATIKKYNGSGEFERYFPEQRGDEVERLKGPSQFAFVYDSLLIYDSVNRKYVKYMKNGSFVNSFWSIMGTSVKPAMLKSDGRTIISAFSFSRENLNGKDYSINKLCLLNEKFKIDQVIREIKIVMDSDFFFPDIIANYAIKNGLFYITENLSDAYRIFVNDDRGKMKYVIEKNYAKIPYNVYEISQLSRFVKESGFPPLDSTKTYYKKAINTIEIDKNDRIWVQPSLDRTLANQDSFYIDIFDKGIFINRTVLDFVKGNETYKIIGNRIYVIAEDKKSFRVYDYE
jgi:hypothetical protein